MRIAIIDCGTNTFNLLITEITGKTPVVLHKEQIPVSIGKGGIEKGIITPEAYQRAMDALQYYAARMKEWKVEKVFATSTSAFRSTENGPQLRDDIEANTGIRVEIISGDVEAEYIYKGVTWALPPLPGANYLIMDIGGGSTEFILYNNQQVLFKESYPLGASRLVEKFKPADPLNSNNPEVFYSYFNQLLEGLYTACKKDAPTYLVGSSGFFDTLRSITHYHFHPGKSLPDTEVNYHISLHEFEYAYQLLIRSNYQERLQIQGMTPFRAELMGISVLLTHHVIQQTGVKEIINTMYALKEGVLKKYLESIP